VGIGSRRRNRTLAVRMEGIADEREYCRLCRTFSAPGERCGNCLRRRDGLDDPLEDALANSLSGARVVHASSRLRAGTTAFGPVGRVLLSIVPALAVVMTAWLAYRFRSGPQIALFLVGAVATAVTMGGFLRLVWRRERVD
jgi:hypothetical protein